MAATLAVSGCTGQADFGLAETDVDHEDALVDAPVEVAADTLVDSAATAATKDSSHWDLGPPVPCGVQADDTYLGPCDLELGPGWRSTLCDEATRRCVPPEASCADGWCYIPPRSYVSGAGIDMSSAAADDATFTVVPRAFLIQETETTLAAFVDVMGYAPDITSTCGDDCPVGSVTVFEAMEYANRLSDREGRDRCYVLEACGSENFQNTTGAYRATGWTCQRSVFAGPECTGYRLPSRAEWELAARAGSPFCLPRGPKEELWDCQPPDHEYAIHCGLPDIDYRPCVIPVEVGEPPVSRCFGPRPVRSSIPNDFGLYEMFGNVQELAQTAAKPPPDFPVDNRSANPTVVLGLADEFAYEIRRDDLIHKLGGAFHNFGRVVCGWTSIPHYLSIGWFLSQDTGFRLVLTAPTR